MPVAHAAPTRSVDRAPLAAAVLVLLATCLAIWLLAVPVPENQVCPAIHPAPRSCSLEGRHGAGAVATLVVVAVYLLVSGVTILARRRWVRWTAVLVLAVTGVVAFAVVP